MLHRCKGEEGSVAKSHAFEDTKIRFDGSVIERSSAASSVCRNTYLITNSAAHDADFARSSFRASFELIHVCGKSR